MEKPYYRKASDLFEFRDIMGEHGNGDMMILVESALCGNQKSMRDAVAAMFDWNAEMDERISEEAKG